MEGVFLTIITPSYNRANYLEKLYHSLIKQKDDISFEWVVIDDGSTDKTQELIDSFVSQKELLINYRYQTNGGKHRAINEGARIARGELIFVVDSDDYLTAGALNTISDVWSEVKKLPDSNEFAGICGLRFYPDGSVIGGQVDYEILDTTTVDYRYRLNYKGDKAEVYRTDILQSYLFPDIKGETFCTEALIWNRIGQTYKMRFFNKGIYVCEYLPDGLSDRSLALRRNNPGYSSLYYAELLKQPKISFRQRIKTAINFWRFAVCDKCNTFSDKRALNGKSWTLLFLPIGYLMAFIDYLRS